MTFSSSCGFSKGFSLKEKLYAQISFFVMLITGSAGILLEDPWLFLPYIFIAWYGVPGIIQRHLVCPRCPHLYEHKDCLQFHPALTRRLVKKRKPARFSPMEKILFLLIFFLIPVYPLYWLLGTPWLMALFLGAALLWYGGQFLYFCRRCRVKDCPFNPNQLNNPKAKSGVKPSPQA